MSKQPVIKRTSTLFSLSDQMKAAEDVVQLRLNKYGEGIHVDICLEDIELKPQVRQVFDAESIQILAQSIKDNGLLYPVIVTKKKGDSSRFILLVGEHRYRAYKYLNYPKIPAIVKDDVEKPSDRVVIQLIENIHRQSLNTIEISDAMMTIRNEEGLTLAELAEKMGKSLDTCKKYSRISQLSDDEKTDLMSNNASFKDVMKYIDSRKKISKDQTDKSEDRHQMSLFKQSDRSFELKRLSVNLQTEEKNSLEEKIAACESFLQLARHKLQSFDDK